MERFYRDAMKAADLTYFKVKIKETDLYIGAENRSVRRMLSDHIGSAQ